MSNNWRNTTRRWKKVCEIKLQLYKSPWESALSETCRRYLTKAIYQLSWNEYNKAWLNTNWLKHRIYLPYSSRNCFESFEYSEKRIASIHKNFFTFSCIHRLSTWNRIPPPLVFYRPFSTVECSSVVGSVQRECTVPLSTWILRNFWWMESAPFVIGFC